MNKLIATEEAKEEKWLELKDTERDENEKERLGDDHAKMKAELIKLKEKMLSNAGARKQRQ